MVEGFGFGGMTARPLWAFGAKGLFCRVLITNYSLIRRPSGVLDESEVKPPFFPFYTPKNACERARGGGGPRILFFMEDAEPARSGVDAADREFRRL